MNGSLLMLTMTVTLAAAKPRPGDWSFGWSSVASIAEVSLAIIVCLWMITGYFTSRQERVNNSPWALFHELCSVHKLTRRERQLLKRIAQQHDLAQPAIVFVESAWWEAEKLGSTWARSMPELDGLRSRLFSH